MNQFGALGPLDHPYMTFPLPRDGGTLHLPCGTLATALEEGKDGTNTTIVVGIPGCEFARWTVAMSAVEVQATFREGALRLNRIVPDLRAVDTAFDDD